MDLLLPLITEDRGVFAGVNTDPGPGVLPNIFGMILDLASGVVALLIRILAEPSLGTRDDEG